MIQNPNILTCCFAIIDRYKKKLVFIIILLLTISETYAQQETDYSVHANIIYRFTKYIQWPSHKQNGDFVIGVVGETQLYDQLRIFVANKTVGNQKIIVKNYAAAAGTFDCQILFVSASAEWNLKKIVSRINAAPTLLITEMDFPASATCINFQIANHRLKLGINKNNIEKRNLNIASELLQLGTLIK